MRQRERETGQKDLGIFYRNEETSPLRLFQVLSNLMVLGRCFCWLLMVSISDFLFVFWLCLSSVLTGSIFPRALWLTEGHSAAVCAHRNGFWGFKNVFRVETALISDLLSQIAAFSVPERSSGTHGHNSYCNPAFVVDFWTLLVLRLKETVAKKRGKGTLDCSFV